MLECQNVRMLELRPEVVVMIIGEGFSLDGVGLFLQPSGYNRGFMAPRVILTGQHKWHVRQRNALLQDFSYNVFSRILVE